MTEAQLRGFADDALRKLDAGSGEAEVKEWAKAAVHTGA